MHELDKGLSVRFFMYPKENHRKSKEAGRPIFEDVEMVSIMAPGNRLTERTAPAHEIHYNGNISEQQTYAERFAEAYEAFKRGVEEQLIGTPLSEMTCFTPAQIAEMRAKNVRTVEQLAGMSDTNIRKMGPNFRANVDAAREYLVKSSDNSTMAAEIEALRKKVAELTSGAPVPEPAAEDEFASYAKEDLKNMIQDAGGKVPPGNASRDTLIKALREIAAEKEEAA